MHVRMHTTQENQSLHANHPHPLCTPTHFSCDTVPHRTGHDVRAHTALEGGQCVCVGGGVGGGVVLGGISAQRSEAEIQFAAGQAEQAKLTMQLNSSLLPL